MHFRVMDLYVFLNSFESIFIVNYFDRTEYVSFVTSLKLVASTQSTHSLDFFLISTMQTIYNNCNLYFLIQ